MESVVTKKISDHLKNLKSLQSNSGLFLASAQNVTTGYDKAWLRDNFYISLGLESAGENGDAKKIFKAILKIFIRHENKISWAVQNKPHASWQYIHARYNAETFEEFWGEWGNKQNDAVGAVLFRIGDFEKNGINVIETDEERHILQKLVDYLHNIQYWEDTDNGIWEEYEEMHASSIGACVAGLKNISSLQYINVPDEIITKGEKALLKLLPRESESKFVDLAQLSLIYPFNVVSKEMADQILINIEYHLVRYRGVIRYRNDRYYNKNEDDISEEAEWVFGFPWLSIIYAQRGNMAKAKYYLSATSRTFVEDNKLPELFYSNTQDPNENIPLGWAESLYIVALKEIGA